MYISLTNERDSRENTGKNKQATSIKHSVKATQTRRKKTSYREGKRKDERHKITDD